MFRLIAINFSQKFPHFSLLSPTSPCELSEREVTSPSNLKVVGALFCSLYQVRSCRKSLDRPDIRGIILKDQTEASLVADQMS
jgi:hypothetical protein